MQLCQLWPYQAVWRKLFRVAQGANGYPTEEPEEPGMCCLMEKIEAIILPRRQNGFDAQRGTG